MDYDINIHIPAQVEQLLNALVKGDEHTERTIDVAIGNIKDILNNDKFNKDLEEYKQKFDNAIKDIEKTEYIHVRTGADVKTLDDIVVTLNMAKESQIKAYNDFINNVKTYILLYMNMVKEDEG